MRELKFRVWIKDEERYYDESGEESFLIVPNGIVLYISEEYEEDGEWFTDKTSATDDVVVEQYTGLKDKNGKEIYEGDIIQEKGLLSLTLVEWDKNNARYITEVLDKSKHVSSTFYFDIITALECEVIGNIHENPELLDVKKEG